MKTKIIDKRILCCILSLLLVLMCVCSSLEVHAMGNISKPSISGLKLVDMCLTRSGKVVNEDIRESVKDQVRNVLNDTATSYWQWLKDNGKSNTTENFKEYLNSDAYASLPIRFVKFPLELGSFINWLINGETILDELGTDIEDVLTETDTDGNLSVPSETVNIINQCFNDIKANYENDVYYVDTYTIDELPTSWFQNQAVYNTVKEYINTATHPSHVFYTRDGNNTYLQFVNQYDSLYLVTYEGEPSNDSYKQYYFKYYNNNWEEVAKCIDLSTAWEQWNIDITCKEDFDTHSWDYSSNTASYFHKGKGVWNWIGDYEPNIGSKCYIFTKDGSPVIVYKSLDAVKNYSLGKSPYFLTNRQYQDSVDNSFNVSGEYLQNNGGNFSYEQIREQINNSNATTDNSVSNIVNDYSQTIINNYYGSGGSGGNDNESDNDSENGILNIIGAIGDVINFILNVIAEVISLISNFLTTVFELLKGLGSVFGSFSGLLGELFVFIPQDLIDLLTTAMSATVIIALWRKFSK